MSRPPVRRRFGNLQAFVIVSFMAHGSEDLLYDPYPPYRVVVKIFYIEKVPHLGYMSPMTTEKPKILLILEDELLARIEDYRFGNRISSRSEAIRRLIEEGLKAAVPPKQKPPRK